MSLSITPLALDAILEISGLDPLTNKPEMTICMNSSGPVNNLNCTEPYCNCSEEAKKIKPEEPEPFDEELLRLKSKTNECNLISRYLGTDWLGCNFDNPHDPSNCNCPIIGKNYWKYLAYTTTNATFWKTDPKTPILRNAQMILLAYQRIMITVHGNSFIRPGHLIEIDVRNDENRVVKNKRFNGKWMVYKTTRLITHNRCAMNLSLMRDTNYIEPTRQYEEIIVSKEKDSNG